MKAITNKKQLTLFYTYIFTALLISAGVVQAKDVPGSSASRADVTSTGAFNYSIDLQIPVGTNGRHPNLGLDFSSSRGNGSLGVGWGFSGLTSIQRCGKTLATDGMIDGVNHDANDRFCLNGQRLILTKGTYGADKSEYRTEIDSFVKIVAHGNGSVNVNGGRAPSWWRIWRKDGSYADYGNSDASKLVLPGTSSIHKWCLSHDYDRNGNYFEVSYQASEALPTRIDYTKNDTHALTADKSVQLAYEVRPDIRDIYIAGKKITKRYRLKTISVKHKEQEVRQYNIAYQTAPVSRLSRALSIQECVGGHCFPATRMSWHKDSAGFRNVSASNNTVVGSRIGSLGSLTEKLPSFLVRTDQYSSREEMRLGDLVDVNGDGLQDLVHAYVNRAGVQKKTTWLQTSLGWQVSAAYRLPTVMRNYEDVKKIAYGPLNYGQFIDINGDGLVDWLVSYRYANAQNSIRQAWLNTGSGWRLSDAYTPPDYQYDYRSDYYNQEVIRGRYVDVNGDGLPDWVRGYFNHFSETYLRRTAINTGDGWRWDDNYNLPSAIYGPKKQVYGNFIDVNRDGLVDWVQSYRSKSKGTNKNTWLNTGKGWRLNNTFRLPDIAYDYGYSDKSLVQWGDFIDLNGDGLTDWILSYINPHTGTTHQSAAINTGKGWVRNAAYKPAFVIRNYDKVDRGFPTEHRGRFVDLNNDGLVDYAESYRGYNGPTSKRSWINTGKGWRQDNAYNVGWLFGDYYKSEGKAGLVLGQFADINGDGSTDWLRTTMGNVDSRINRQVKLDRIAAINSTMGVKYSPIFSPLTETGRISFELPFKSGDTFSDARMYRKHEQGDPTPIAKDAFLIHSPIYVVSKLSVSNPVGSENTSYYYYIGAQIHRKGRGFLGFHKRIVVDHVRDLNQKFEYKQDFPLSGMMVERSVSNIDIDLEVEKVFSQSKTIEHDNNNQTHFPYILQQSVQRFQLDGTPYVNELKRFTYDDYGNITERYEQTTDRSNFHELGQTRTTYRKYKIDIDNWLISLLSSERMKYQRPGESDIVRRRFFAYDDLGRLNLTIREQNASDETKLSTHLVYDNFGNILTEMHRATGEDPRTTHYQYDEQYRLPTQVRNAKGHVTKVAYNDFCDQPATQTDPNGLVVSYEYDSFCRESKQTDAAGISVSTRYTLFGDLSTQCPSCQQTPKMVIEQARTGHQATKTYVDIFNRPMVSVTKGMYGDDIEQVIQYDELGRTIKESQSYFVGDEVVFNTYQYDVLDRLVSSNMIGRGTTRFDYDIENGLQLVTETDTYNKQTTRYLNPMQELVEVKDADNNSLLYQYDATGNLVLTEDAQGNMTFYEYDVLGRQLSIDDPSMGVWKYQYNAFGEIVRQTDAKQQTITMTYDNLGRLTRRTVPAGSASTVSTWNYDSGAKGIGSVSSIQDDNDYKNFFLYDDYGRLSRNNIVIKGKAYRRQYQYNDIGLLSYVRYPDAGSEIFAVDYAYKNGYLRTINNARTGKEYWRANKYDALGRVTNDRLGDIITTNRRYSAEHGVLKGMVAKTSTAILQDIYYSYDDVQNLTQRRDTLTGSTQAFEYDNLYRLTGNNFVAGGMEQRRVNVNYDAIGNITYKSDVGHYSYDESGGPFAVSRVTPVATTPDLSHFTVNWLRGTQSNVQTVPNIHNTLFTYDANGNILQSGDRKVGWTAFNKPKRLQRTHANGSVTGSVFEYNPAFERISKLDYNNVKTVYIDKDYEEITENGKLSHRYYISAGSNSVQVTWDEGSDRAEEHYILTDFLGSTDTIVNAQGEVVQKLAFDPWGMRVAVDNDIQPVNSIATRGHTGHEMHDNVGLTNMNARIYDPYLGRFLSADSVTPNMANMQSHNRYAYVRNNPLKYVDPTGNYDEEVVVTGRRPTGVDLSFSFLGVGRSGHLNGAATGAYVWGGQYLEYIESLVDMHNQEFNEMFEQDSIVDEDVPQISEDEFKRDLNNLNETPDTFDFSDKFKFDIELESQIDDFSKLLDNITNASDFSGLFAEQAGFKRLAKGTNFFSNALTPLSVGLDFIQVQNGTLSAGRAAFNSSITGISLAAGIVNGPAGVAVTALGLGSEFTFDAVVQPALQEAARAITVVNGAGSLKSNVNSDGRLNVMTESFGFSVKGFNLNF